MSKQVKYTDPGIKRKRYRKDYIPGTMQGTKDKKGSKSITGDVLLENTFILTKQMNKRCLFGTCFPMSACLNECPFCFRF